MTIYTGFYLTEWMCSWIELPIGRISLLGVWCTLSREVIEVQYSTKYYGYFSPCDHSGWSGPTGMVIAMT